MDDYDAGYAKGYRDGEETGWENGHECGTGQGFDDGMSHAQEKILKLMDEVIHEYKMQKINMQSSSHQISQAQLNAVEFMKNWVLSGGVTDEEGNRACLVW